jgi:hypothetical protein
MLLCADVQIYVLKNILTHNVQIQHHMGNSVPDIIKTLLDIKRKQQLVHQRILEIQLLKKSSDGGDSGLDSCVSSAKDRLQIRQPMLKIKLTCIRWILQQVFQ